MEILDGKKISNQIKDEIAIEVAQMKERGEKVPHLAAVLVGNDGASLTYVGSKVRSCKRIGFESTLIHLPAETTEEELLAEVEALNANAAIDGYIVQLPCQNILMSRKY
jgi:methylenetetrahydrofolate dehydrogenase (NADP+)/methenyltetrahydrofolate cyclohydrolase